MRRLSPALAALAILVLTLLPAHAIFMEKPLENPAQEARAQELMKELRCLVCQNQAISESHAPLARDLRIVLRERIAAGDSDAEALDYMVQRFGDWVLLNPPFNVKTVILWFGGPFIFLVGLGLVIMFLRRQRRSAPSANTGVSAPLDPAERVELQRALSDKG
ncbi:cytochrome c-type biogenesis protein CcmH [Minwuia sp.]|uniref:cytochrome c-type biogenesis protein n=1 Tax=Minwuia sp. TaxID=2493630 RepID=UPI003A911AB8